MAYLYVQEQSFQSNRLNQHMQAVQLAAYHYYVGWTTDVFYKQ